jgi:glycosyltransferase involved in cell wall biosynthesis
MKVLQVIDALYIGGAEKMALFIGRALHECGIGSALCLTREPGEGGDQLAEGVSLLQLHRSEEGFFKSRARLRRFVIEEKITHIHVHSTSFFFVVASLFDLDLPIFWHTHSGKLPQIGLMKRTLYRFFLPRVSGVIAVNRAVQKWLGDTFSLAPDQITFITNFAEDDNVNDEPASLPGTAGRRLLSLANVRPQKEHMTLVRAFAQSSLCKDWDLMCLGSLRDEEHVGRVRDEVERLGISDRVHFFGVRDDVFSVINACDVAVIASEAEGLPVSLLEFGLAGIPVISTDVGECREVLGRGRFGKLVPSRDHDALAAALDEIAFDYEKARLRAEDFRIEVENHYSKESTMKKLLAFYAK